MLRPVDMLQVLLHASPLDKWMMFGTGALYALDFTCSDVIG